MDSLKKDIGYALRSLRKNLGFAAIAIVMIGLGVGACTAIFSVVNTVLLRPLPYADPSRLVLVWTELRARNVLDFPFPIPDVKDLREETKTLESVAGLFAPGRGTIGADEGHPELIRVGATTTNLFSVLGARMVIGRDFTDEDGIPQPQNAAPNGGGQPAAGAQQQAPRLPIIAILSYPFWQRKYGGDATIVGKMIDLNGNRAQIVGVLAPGFELLFPPRTGIEPDVDMWTALRLNFDTAARNTGALRVIARLKPGVSLTNAQADAESIATTLRDRYVLKKNANVHFRVVPMHDDLVGEVRTSILALFGAVVFVLLIASANVANLLMVRAAARQRELVIRAAIGCSRLRLVRQMLTESLVLAGLGAVLGLVLAESGIEVLLAMAPAKLPRIGSIGIDPSVLAFAAVVTIATALVFGVVPALRASRPDVVEVLRVGGSPGLRGGRGLRSGVAIVELALSFVLMVGFGLMLRSFVALQHVDPGYDPNQLLAFVLQAPQQTEEGRAVFVRQVGDTLRALPGVASVSAASPLPLDGGVSLVPWATEAAAVDPSAFRQANFHTVLPGYFEALKTPVMAGRTFSADDNVPTTDKVVVDDLLAARAFPNESAVGKTLLIRNLRRNGPNPPDNEKVQIIGVVRHQRHESMTSEGREAIFLVERYLGAGSATRWVVRTAGQPESVGPSVRAAIAELDSKIAVADMRPMSTFVDKSLAPTRFAMTLIGAFAGIALLLAGVGLYGVLSTAVRQRTAEIGMRIVFGASRGSIQRLIVFEGVWLSLVGVVLGLIGAFGITGAMRSMLIAVTPTDPTTFVMITALFFVIAAFAAWLPARRAALLDPSVALREE
jgi:putative ABC transport system permease protein